MEKRVTLTFEPVAHRYTDETGKVYTSVTTVIGKYKEVFDKGYWGMYTALKNKGFKVKPDKDRKGIHIDGVFRSMVYLAQHPTYSKFSDATLVKWERVTKIACDRGNEIHDFLEDGINLSKGDITAKGNDVIQPQGAVATLAEVLELKEIKTVHDLDKTTIGKRYPAVYKRLLSYINYGWTIYAEKKVYSTEYGIAGMIDVLLVRGKQFCIMDWKTNKAKMLFKSGYYKKVRARNGDWVKGNDYIETGDTLLYPLNKIEDCKGMLYTLQLSLYAYVMELWGYKLIDGGLEIFHMRPGLEPKLIKVRYLKNDIKNMLEHHKNGARVKKSNKPKLFNRRG